MPTALIYINYRFLPIFHAYGIREQVAKKEYIQHMLTDLTQISIYGAVCSICFANLSIHEQKAKPKNNGLKIINSQVIII